jgi:hypothetical protein
MDIFKPDFIHTLIERQPAPSVSIYMPVYLEDKEIQQNPIRLKNLLGKAGGKLLDAGVDEDELLKIFQPVKHFMEDLSFWQKPAKGMAMFVDSEGYRQYWLPQDPGEIALTGDQFYVKPLISLIQENRLFYVLALNLKNVQLWRCNRYSREEVSLKDVSISIEELLKYEDPEKSLQFHTGTGGSGKRPAIFHGHGTAGDDTRQKKIILQFFKTLDKELRKQGFYQRMKEESAPLLLAGIESHAGMFLDIAGYPGTMKDYIAKNPEDLNDERLLDQAWKIVGGELEKDKAEIIDKYWQSGDNRMEDNDPSEILKAAASKQIDTLFTIPNNDRWGLFDPDRMVVKVDALRESGDNELVNLAIIHTLRNGGNVYILDKEKMPGEKDMAAILRF